MQKSVISRAAVTVGLLPAGALFVWAFSPFGNYYLAFLMLPVLLLLCREQQTLPLFLRCWLFFSGFFIAAVYWIYFSMHVYGNLNRVEVLLMISGFAAYLALYPAIALASARRLGAFDSKIGMYVVVPLLWVLFEWLRGWLFTGFPWMTLGYSQTGSVFGQLASLTGVYGVSALVVIIGSMIYFLFENRIRYLLVLTGVVFALGLFEWWLVLTAISVLVLIYFVWQKQYQLLAIPAVALFIWAYSFIPWTAASGQLKIALLQANVNQAEKWNKPDESIKLYEGLAKTALKHKPDLIIWPETAVPAYYDMVEKTLIARLQKLYAATGVESLIGLPVRIRASRPDQPIRQSWVAYNSAVNIGDTIQQYHKVHLVPFGEYTPFHDWLSGFYDALNIEMNTFTKGTIGQALIRVKNFPLGVFICYEIAFPHEVIRRLPQAGLLVNLSNNAWFFDPYLRGRSGLSKPLSFWTEDSSQSYQQLQMAQMRAIETGRNVISVTNDGVTAVIDYQGRVTKSLPRYSLMVLEDNVGIRRGSTPFVVWGNWLVIGLTFLALLIIAVYKYKSGRNAA